MPGIHSFLTNCDLDFLNRIAQIWGAEISQRDVLSAREDLGRFMVDVSNLQTVLTELPQEAQKTWEELLANQGKIPWALFSRKYGEIRSLGPARRERENPDKKPASISETLWYSGLIGKAFLKVRSELVEMIYIPDEFLALTTSTQKMANLKAIRPAVNQKPKFVQLADSSLLDHLTDVLASLRMSRLLPSAVYDEWGIPQSFFNAMLRSADLVDEAGQPATDRLRVFFQQDRAGALLKLFQAWKVSSIVNELRMLSGLVFEGSWSNDPVSPRQMLLSIMGELQPGTWWSLSSLIASIKDQSPDFQRPAGDYDSWFIREEYTDHYLRGFEYWDSVEGRLLESLVTGPFHWLGLVDLARGDSGGKFTAFRLNENSSLMIKGETPILKMKEDREVEFKGSTSLVIFHNTPREVRYQVGRFCDFKNGTTNESIYSLTPASLEAASTQGLRVNQLLQLLEKHQLKSVPTSFKRIALRWQEHGLEAAFKSVVILRFTEAEACIQFTRQPLAAKYIVEPLNSTTLLIHREGIEGARRLLAEMGILAQIDPDV